MVELYDGPLDVEKIFSSWLHTLEGSNKGAFIPFVGIVREEGGISALSFDIYDPLLEAWFTQWQTQAATQNALVMMAHSRGDVPIHTSSYIAAVASPQRKVALRLICEFVEDFKANAPIWKYDIIGNERRYAHDRSTALPHSGLLTLS